MFPHSTLKIHEYTEVIRTTSQPWGGRERSSWNSENCCDTKLYLQSLNTLVESGNQVFNHFSVYSKHIQNRTEERNSMSETMLSWPGCKVSRYCVEKQNRRDADWLKQRPLTCGSRPLWGVMRKTWGVTRWLMGQGRRKTLLCYTNVKSLLRCFSNICFFLVQIKQSAKCLEVISFMQTTSQ